MIKNDEWNSRTGKRSEKENNRTIQRKEFQLL